MSHHPVWNIPNALSFSRVPLAVALFACMSERLWAVGLAIFVVAMLTDWADGWWARKFGPLSMIGRNLDPLTDKVLLCGAFIYFLLTPDTLVLPWMANLIVARELLVTGIRGIVEATGQKFGADWFGKLKTILQCVTVTVLLTHETARAYELLPTIPWQAMSLVFLYLTLAATALSGLQYVVKAAKLLRNTPLV
jgi:CDP-diacylglycerol---glycerol-3-phosphate 3-phosphatidyltransferase